MTEKTDTTFLKITNKDIYKEIKSIKASLLESQQLDDQKFNAIIRRLDITNGKIKANRLLITGLWTAISVIVGGLVWLINYTLI